MFVNDGSKDSTWEIIRELAGSDGAGTGASECSSGRDVYVTEKILKMLDLIIIVFFGMIEIGCSM